MAGRHIHVDPTTSVRERPAEKSARREQRRRDRPNSWFALLRAAVADDLAERGDLPDLSQDEMLTWADAYHARTGQWPTWNAGPVPNGTGETWLAVEAPPVPGLSEIT